MYLQFKCIILKPQYINIVICKIHLTFGSQAAGHESLQTGVSESDAPSSTLTLGDEILRYTRMGAKEVLASCDGWLMVSQSNTTSCKVLASSNIRSISAWTSAIQEDLEFERSIRALLLGLLRRLRLAREISALTLVMITLWRRRRWLDAHSTPPSLKGLWGSLWTTPLLYFTKGWTQPCVAVYTRVSKKVARTCVRKVRCNMLFTGLVSEWHLQYLEVWCYLWATI